MRIRLARAALPLIAIFLAVLANEAAARAGDGTTGLYMGIRAIGSPYGEMKNTKATGFAGPLVIDHDGDQATGPAGVIGWRFKNFPLRTEIEGGYRVRFDYDVHDQAPGGIVDYSMNVATVQVLVNAALEWRNSSSFTPYIGGTVGWARNMNEAQRTVLPTQAKVTLDQNQDNIAYGGLIGVDWRFADHWSADLAYRFINLGEVKSANFPTGEQVTADSYLAHDVLISVFYRF